MSDVEVLTAFHAGLRRTREHLWKALLEAQQGGSHGEMYYNLHAGGALLMAIFDGITTRAINSNVQDVVAILDRSLKCDLPMIRYDIATGFKPWKFHAEETDGVWDVHETLGSGPVLRGLVFPLFNYAVEALKILYGLVGLEDKEPIRTL